MEGIRDPGSAQAQIMRHVLVDR